MLVDKLNQASGYRCERFGGYPVTAAQYCDSFERGKPGSEKKAGSKYEKPHHLHISTGMNSCEVCTYYWENHK